MGQHNHRCRRWAEGGAAAAAGAGGARAEGQLPIGGVRTHDGDAAIDASATLPDGSSFVGPAGVREHLLDRQERFVTSLTKKLLTYALGRGLEEYDPPAVRRIVRDAEANDYRWSSLVTGIVESMPFRMRRSS